ADADDVLAVTGPHLLAAKARGVGLLCEATPIGVGRRADIVAKVARACGLPVALATGFYVDPWIPDEARAASVDALAERLAAELDGGIEGTDVRAGFIKLGTSDGGMTACEEKLLRAACAASRRTGALICSHTTSAEVAGRALDILAEEGVAGSRFAWFHASSAAGSPIFWRVAGRGAYLGVDYDRGATLPLLMRLADAGLLSRILLSMDSGWYNPRFPGGGDVRGYTAMLDELFEKLPAAGIDARALRTIVHDNVFMAYAR
ncbi:MAG: esterase, partial [Clostridiales bacterium]|nr:esterase [Clostridiales bacterium]